MPKVKVTKVSLKGLRGYLLHTVTVLVFSLKSKMRFFFFSIIRVNPDQIPRFEASDLGLHCLLISLLSDTRRKWVNGNKLILQQLIRTIVTPFKNRSYYYI